MRILEGIELRIAIAKARGWQVAKLESSDSKQSLWRIITPRGESSAIYGDKHETLTGMWVYVASNRVVNHEEDLNAMFYLLADMDYTVTYESKRSVYTVDISRVYENEYGNLFTDTAACTHRSLAVALGNAWLQLMHEEIIAS